MKKQTPEKRRATANTLFTVGAFTALLGVGLRDARALALIGIGLIVASVVYQIVFYRCPHCGEYLGRNRVETCPHCGSPLGEADASRPETQTADGQEKE